jgi:hypothetical protein
MPQIRQVVFGLSLMCIGYLACAAFVAALDQSLETPPDRPAITNFDSKR